MSDRVPGFAQHLFLLWKLRFDIGLNKGGLGRWWISAIGFIASSSPAVVTAISFYALMQHPVVVNSEVWPLFILRLLAFVTTCVWATWPLMSGGVDDHSEVSRFSAFPISSLRLLAASTIASLFEPRAIVFYGPLVGAFIGYARTQGLSHPFMTVLVFSTYVLMNAAISRVGLNSMLTVLRQPRSAELLGGGFVISLCVAAFIPPVDTRWLFDVSNAGVGAVPDAVLSNAVLALGRFPTGWVAHALQGSLGAQLRNLLGLAEIGLFAMVISWGLLIDFHRASGRGGSTRSATERDSNPFAQSKTRFSTLVIREALDLFHNPRARLLVSVPFVLGILMKLLSARMLFAAFLGDAADLWVMGGLGIYGAIVMGSTFSQNAFAYDGFGFAVFLTAPQKLGEVLRAKNLVHALSALGLSVAVIAFYVLYFQAGSALDVVCALLGILTLIPTVIAAGNFLSVIFPVKFHANLKRRDKLPFIASMLGVAAASLGSFPFGWVTRSLHTSAPSWDAVALLGVSATFAMGVYWLTLPSAMKLLEARREIILRSVTRE